MQTQGKRAGFGLAWRVLVQELPEARLPGPPLSHRRPFCAHMAQALEFGMHAYPKARHACLHTRCEPFGRADQIRETTLPESLPVLIDKVPIAHEDAGPVCNALRKRTFGALLGVSGSRQHKDSTSPTASAGHTGKPRGLVYVMHQGCTRDRANGRVVRQDRFGDTINPLLDCPLAQRYPTYRGTQVLHRTTDCSHDARQLTHDACEPRAIAILVRRDGRLQSVPQARHCPWCSRQCVTSGRM